jgi:hypothetical protein
MNFVLLDTTFVLSPHIFVLFVLLNRSLSICVCVCKQTFSLSERLKACLHQTQILCRATRTLCRAT